jgi:ubiquitin-activating enzyme E1
VVLTDCHSNEDIARINTFCHQKKIAFVAADTFGLFGYIFCDFGDEFLVIDRTGEPEKKGFVEIITQDQQGLVTLLEGKMHDLEDGDVVTFSEVGGMDELNGKRFEVKVKST